MHVRELYEGRDAPLYHSTTAKGAISILKTGRINPTHSIGDGYGHADTKPNISLTRDKRYWVGIIQFTISQEKLSQTHKIIPYALQSDDYPDYEPDDEDDEEDWDSLPFPGYARRTEAEERVYTPIPISYIELIRIDRKHLDKFYLQKLLEMAKDLNIPISNR